MHLSITSASIEKKLRCSMYGQIKLLFFFPKLKSIVGALFDPKKLSEKNVLYFQI